MFNVKSFRSTIIKIILIIFIAISIFIVSSIIYSIVHVPFTPEIRCQMYFDFLEEEPEIFINITPTILSQYPLILDGINNGSINRLCKDFDELLDFFDEMDTRNVYYNESYYHILFATP